MLIFANTSEMIYSKSKNYTLRKFPRIFLRVFIFPPCFYLGDYHHFLAPMTPRSGLQELNQPGDLRRVLAVEQFLQSSNIHRERFQWLIWRATITLSFVAVTAIQVVFLCF